jgi:hypothetical protein
VNCLIDSNKSFIENPPVAGTEPGDHVEPVVSNEAAVEEQRHLEQEIRTQIADSYIPKKNAEAKGKTTSTVTEAISKNNNTSFKTKKLILVKKKI